MSATKAEDALLRGGAPDPGEADAGEGQIGDTPFTLLIDRVIAAPRGVVWRCWTEAALLKQWYCPAPWTVPETNLDVRPGGRFNTIFAGPDGERMENVGMWLEVVPETRLTFTDAYTEGFVPRAESFMTGFVRLSDDSSGGTRMTWGARHKGQADMEAHLAMGFEAGWNTAADQLDALAQRVAKGA